MERMPNRQKEDPVLLDWLEKWELEDTARRDGDFNIMKHYTHRGGGTFARLDYQATNSLDYVLEHKVVGAARIKTSHRMVVCKYDLWGLCKGRKTVENPFAYPMPMRIDRSDVGKVEKFRKEEEAWTNRLDPSLYLKAYDGNEEDLEYIWENQDTLLEKIGDLCVKKAREIWVESKTNRRNTKASKTLGVCIGLNTRIKRAMTALDCLLKYKNGQLEMNREQIKSFEKNLNSREGLEDISANSWAEWSETQIKNWFELVKLKRKRIYEVIDEEERKVREKDKKKALNRYIGEGIANSRAFRRWRLFTPQEQEGAAVKMTDGEIAATAEKILWRYNEYYGGLLSQEEERKTPPNEEHRQRWMKEENIKERREKLNAALNGRNIAQELPTTEEFFEVVMHGKPNSSPGKDGIQYGVLHIASFGTQKVILGIIRAWWRKRQIPERLREVHICSLHKDGDRLDLMNKRGIGLVSKLVLIMEAILIARMQKALDKAGIRSKAQGGATKGVQTMDVIATIVNIVSHAKRHRNKLYMVEFDLFKFFDRIPHRAFVDAHKFFGFHDDVIEMASLFWMNFTGRARTRYGLTEEFIIGLGNIQGLVGSPFRSCMVLDMFLLVLEEEKFGYRFHTDAHHGTRDDALDDIILLIYAIAWVDDIWLIDDDYERIAWAVDIYNKFATYYTMRFVVTKCHFYVMNDTIEEDRNLWLTNYLGESQAIPVVYATKDFRCLGAYFNLNLGWEDHFNKSVKKLREFGEALARGWAPPYLTAKLVNSNGTPKITFGLGLAEFDEAQIRYLQGLLVAPVKKDGSHSSRAPYAAYTMNNQEGGYNIMDLSAIYKANKVNFVHRLLNGIYGFSTTTLRMHLLDLQRKLGLKHFPLSQFQTVEANKVKKQFPPYIKSVMKIMREIGMGKNVWVTDP